jgi:hypothetical protein
MAELPEAIAFLMRRLEAEAAVAGDIPQLMDALPPLANVLRYGNVRRTDTESIAHVVAGLMTRICIGLGPACSSLDDDAADAMLGRVLAVDASVKLLQDTDHLENWMQTLERLSDQQGLHGMVAGRCVRLLLDAQRLTSEEAARRMNLSLSAANDPAQAGGWVEGFLRGSGLVLLLDERLWSVLDNWVSSLQEEHFVSVLPLLRRTFSSFETAERRQIGERVAKGGVSTPAIEETTPAELDRESVDKALGLLAQVLGVENAS